MRVLKLAPINITGDIIEKIFLDNLFHEIIENK